ncbi:hypothetical protein INR49_011689 [Caranx melampygus]|nr:hypothetical protein INR49_011689 [Caranx melampygus]
MICEWALYNKYTSRVFGRLGTVCMWKALLLFIAMACVSQLLRVILNKSSDEPAAESTFLSPDVQVHSLRSCQPLTHIMFLKTHKTASSTVLNILYRFGDEHDLRFALPNGYRLGYPLYFSAHTVKGYQGPSAVEKVMPADTFYFSIIRDPVSTAESSFDYMRDIAPAFKNAKSFGDFASDPKKYYDPRLSNNHFAHNPVWFDFGLDNNANFSVALAQRGETKIRQTFKLILLSEYFDQSMILLRHALCWPLDAVVSFSLNARQEKPSSDGTPPKLSLTEEQREKLRQWNAFDWYLYQAFNQTFWEEINKFGVAQMEQEVALLRMRREQLAQDCLGDSRKRVEANQIQNKKIRPYQSGRVKILGYELQPGLDNATRTICLRMIRPELQYKDILDAKQFPVKAQPGQQSQVQKVR